MRLFRAAAALVVALPVLAGCANTVGTARQQLPKAAAAAKPATVTVGTINACDDTKRTRVESYQPTAADRPGNPSATLLGSFKSRGTLIVGTAGDVPLWGNRGIDNQLTGFDIQLSRQIAKALFGDENRVVFKTINYAQRIPFLQDGSVDIVAHTMTINCARWKQIDFSTEYYHAAQRLLVRRDDQQITDYRQLAGKRVCVAAGSTNLDHIKEKAPQANLTVVSDLGDCFVRFQQGTVDAITGDDTVIAGFASQDPGYAKLVGDGFSDEPYGIGVSAKRQYLTRFVNAVLEQLRVNGELKRIYESTQGNVSGVARDWTPPPAVYGRTRTGA